MKPIAGVCVLLLGLLPFGAALAQPAEDVLNEVHGGYLSEPHRTTSQTWRAYFVQTKGAAMIVRADDGKTYTVEMSAVPLEAWQGLALGQPVTLAARAGAGPQMLTATRIDPRPHEGPAPARGTRRFRAAHGAVERVDGSRLTVQTSEAGRLTVDVSALAGVDEFRLHDGVRVILEPGSPPTAVWIEREDRRGLGRRDILSGLGAEYRRVLGHRVHASGSTMVFLGRDGVTSLVDMAAVGNQGWQALALGQAVALAVKPGHAARTLVAARVQADSVDRPTDHASRRAFVAVTGTVEAVDGSQLDFKQTHGPVIRADASGMPGHAASRVGEHGLLIYEIGSRRQVTALWLARGEGVPAP